MSEALFEATGSYSLNVSSETPISGLFEALLQWDDEESTIKLLLLGEFFAKVAFGPDQCDFCIARASGEARYMSFCHFDQNVAVFFYTVREYTQVIYLESGIFYCNHDSPPPRSREKFFVMGSLAQSGHFPIVGLGTPAADRGPARGERAVSIFLSYGSPAETREPIEALEAIQAPATHLAFQAVGPRGKTRATLAHRAARPFSDAASPEAFDAAVVGTGGGTDAAFGHPATHAADALPRAFEMIAFGTGNATAAAFGNPAVHTVFRAALPAAFDVIPTRARVWTSAVFGNTAAQAGAAFTNAAVHAVAGATMADAFSPTAVATRGRTGAAFGGTAMRGTSGVAVPEPFNATVAAGSCSGTAGRLRAETVQATGPAVPGAFNLSTVGSRRETGGTFGSTAVPGAAEAAGSSAFGMTASAGAAGITQTGSFAAMPLLAPGSFYPTANAVAVIGGTIVQAAVANVPAVGASDQAIGPVSSSNRTAIRTIVVPMRCTIDSHTPSSVALVVNGYISRKCTVGRSTAVVACPSAVNAPEPVPGTMFANSRKRDQANGDAGARRSYRVSCTAIGNWMATSIAPTIVSTTSPVTVR